MKDYNKLISVFQNNAKGFKRRIDLEYACNLMGVEYNMNIDRQLRRIFKAIAKDGILIASNCKSSGYWLTSKEMIEIDPEEKEQVEIMVRENYSRIKKIRENISPFKKALNEGDQLEFNY